MAEHCLRDHMQWGLEPAGRGHQEAAGDSATYLSVVPRADTRKPQRRGRYKPGKTQLDSQVRARRVSGSGSSLGGRAFPSSRRRLSAGPGSSACRPQYWQHSAPVLAAHRLSCLATWSSQARDRTRVALPWQVGS